MISAVSHLNALHIHTYSSNLLPFPIPERSTFPWNSDSVLRRRKKFAQPLLRSRIHDPSRSNGGEGGEAKFYNICSMEKESEEGRLMAFYNQLKVASKSKVVEN